MGAFEELCSDLRARDDVGERVAALLAGLADRLAATSNDQNVQRLARELRAASPRLELAVVGGAA